MVYFKAVKYKLFLIIHYDLVKYIHLSRNLTARIPGG